MVGRDNDTVQMAKDQNTRYVDGDNNSGEDWWARIIIQFVKHFSALDFFYTVLSIDTDIPQVSKRIMIRDEHSERNNEGVVHLNLGV